MNCPARMWPKCLTGVSLVFLLLSCAQTAKDTPAAFTDSATPSGYNFPHPANVAEPTVHGAWVVQSGTSLCLDCHKTDTNTTLPGPRCDSCHAVYPHADGWVAQTSHGKYVIDNGTTNCQTQCHGTDLAGGLSTISCTKCHETYPHMAEWQTDTSHLHGASARTDKNVCKLCHGNTFGGGQSAVKCSDCHAPYPHADSWVAATGAASVHGPIVDVGGSTQCEGCHGANTTSSIFSTYCSDCHKQHLSSPITCKGCHEAGTGLADTRPSATEENHLTTQDCASCHDYSTGDFKILRGETKDFTQSGHASSTGAFAAESNSTSCMRCHTATGFKSYIHNGTQNAGALATQTTPDPLTCSACHNADTASYGSGVTFDTSGFVPGEDPSTYGTSGKHLTLTINGKEAICLRCHAPRSTDGAIKINAWVYGLAVDSTSAVKYSYPQYPGNETAKPAGTVATNQARTSAITSHYMPIMSTFYGNDAKLGFQYVTDPSSNPLTYVGRNDLMTGFDTCIKCHNPHTTEVQPAKCITCHAGATTTAAYKDIRVTTSDYDGDGNTTEGTYYEVEGVKAKLLQAIQNYAAIKASIAFDPVNYSSSPWRRADSLTTVYDKFTPRLVKALYNYHLAYRDAAAYIHNSKYIVELLYDSIKDLNAAPGMTPVDMTGMVRP